MSIRIMNAIKKQENYVIFRSPLTFEALLFLAGKYEIILI